MRARGHVHLHVAELAASRHADREMSRVGDERGREWPVYHSTDDREGDPAAPGRGRPVAAARRAGSGAG
jgi:hypothetical protein